MELGIPGIIPALPNNREAEIEHHTGHLVAKQEQHPLKIVDGKYEVDIVIDDGEDDLQRAVRLANEATARHHKRK